ncbi:MAG: FecR domain-containing protein [Candidatus Marinimicrobia bacterium]|nr:FecR domain-containing protein [Candidatus Neomarinimicrobiota bacterium]
MKKILIISIILFTMVLGAGKVAITVKSSGTVNHLHSDKSPTTPLKLGTGLADEDIIRTGQNGFAVAMYLDDKTAIKIRENSEFLIGGTKSENGINKRVALNYGTMAASVSKQKGKEFIIATPTSVASVKGTDIVIISDPVLGDLFITLVGSIVVTNSTTGDSTTVGAGETATSTADGGLDVTTTDEDDIPDFDGDGETSGELHELRFEIEDPDGNLKEVIIQY